MNYIKSNSIDLIITSPPYPMISMWDTILSKQNKKIKIALEDKNGKLAFELMHKELDKVWKEAYRVLKDGGIACINIGDATRTIDGKFQLYPNHSRILNYCFKVGFDVLPTIIWRKQTNAPNKFMGSGMLPVGAYVTLEHELILILRKNGKRNFIKNNEKIQRQESSFFWEERNLWFSDIWFDIKGTNQKLLSKKTRKRSAAFPFNLAYRLINMYSVKNDNVLDPFLGTGTTTMAAMASQRNSLGIELDKSFGKIVSASFKKIIDLSNKTIKNRIDN
ncbi:MAG: site-specific DNA-methyltransferase, partial [Candidatus Portnoybacteria bacterium]|nr:site-specific DNA-methyltransferase [Candidatus Portnoybacteria bacterium]